MIKNFLCAGLLTAAATLHAVDIIKDNKSLSKIYIASIDQSETPFDKLDTEKQKDRILATAVKDLNYHLKKMSGNELEIVITSDPAQIKAPAIVIGTLAYKSGITPKNKSEMAETFRIKTENDILFISGESPAACAYGIYEILSILGCDWVMPGKNGEIIPEKNNISLEELDIEQSPSFAVRCPWYSGGANVVTKKDKDEFDQWKLRHKEQISREWHPMMMIGGHVWDSLVKKYKKKFAEHPEMLALVRQPDGTMKRQGPQLETTNAEVLDIFAEYIRELFAKNSWPVNKNICIGIGPADGGGFSESPESANAASGRIDPMSGEADVTDIQILLCNQLIKKLEHEFPNLKLGFYLYNTHADYPMRYAPDKKVTIVLADITYSRFHGLKDKTSKTRAYYNEIIEQWALLHRKQGNDMFFRGYNWNLAENFLPYTKLKIWGEDIPFYKKMGIIGFYNECSKAWALLGPSDYLEAKLTWNADLDWKKVLAEYCRNSFGKGAPFIEKYYLELTEKQSRSGHEAGSYHAFALMYDNTFINNASALFEKAENSAEKASEKQRIQFARIPVNMLKHYLEFRAAYSSFDFSEACRKFELMKTEIQKHEKTDSNLVCRSSLRYLDRFYSKLISEGVKFSSGEYRIIFSIPDYLKTAFDSSNSGHSMGFFRTEINDKDYIRTATFSSTWDAQGLIGYRSGSVWYRVPFNIAEELKDQPLGLFIGGADSIVRIWCNGKYIGMGQGFAKPFQFDLTELVNSGKNLLVIQVQRFGNSEIGTGGLIYPSFIFTGPRLESCAPKIEKAERMLPGGEREAVK